MIKDGELIITTAEGFDIIRIINKLGMKDIVADTIIDYFSLENSKKVKYIELNKLCLDKDENYEQLEKLEKENIINTVFLENKELQLEISRMEGKTKRLLLDLLFTFIDRFPQAEKEIYKTLAKIYNKTAKEIEIDGIDGSVELIIGLSKSATIPKLLSFFN